MQIDIVTIFPDMFGDVFRYGIVGRAMEAGLVTLRVHDLRHWTVDRHRSADDTPYGGGPGMVMKAEPLVAAIGEIVRPDLPDGEKEIILLSPRGKRMHQTDIRRLAAMKQLVLVAGRYEGVDERFPIATAAIELSIGDYVLSGGEIPAMVVADAVVRLIPGAISHPKSAEEDSFSRGLLDYPHYTRPAKFRNLRVPDVLLSGNHAAIRRWRKEQAVRATIARRPDMLSSAEMDDEECAILKELESSQGSQTVPVVISENTDGEASKHECDREVGGE